MLEIKKSVQCPVCNANYIEGIYLDCPVCSGVQVAMARPLNGDAPISFAKKKTDPQTWEPVCGWLVVTEGSARGRYFRVGPEKSSIGGAGNTVDLSFDPKIDTRESGVILYDDDDFQFWLMNGSGKNKIRINGKPLIVPLVLQKGDVLRLGDTTLIFIPFCTKESHWESRCV